MVSEIVIKFIDLIGVAFYSILEVIDNSVADNVQMMPLVIGMIVLMLFLNIGFWRTLLLFFVMYYIYLKYYN